MQKISIGDITKLIPILKLAKEKAIEFSDNGDFLSAIKLAKSGLKLSPRDDEFMMIIGVAYLDLENYADALIYLKRAVLKTNDSEIKAVIREIESGEYQKNIENNKDN
ncbi:tetratricopeptide repeat protein [Pedobacter borealis]|uniref:tetratricopeptide repeat protein n=1 Tax=Pedobacter borealis TaxID=475254 RepID=UPI00049355B5|nr:tetratricopeptide repeat protein [Pedobacter borealis]